MCFGCRQQAEIASGTKLWAAGKLWLNSGPLSQPIIYSPLHRPNTNAVLQQMSDQTNDLVDNFSNTLGHVILECSNILNTFS